MNVLRKILRLFGFFVAGRRRADVPVPVTSTPQMPVPVSSGPYVTAGERKTEMITRPSAPTEKLYRPPYARRKKERRQAKKKNPQAQKTKPKVIRARASLGSHPIPKKINPEAVAALLMFFHNRALIENTYSLYQQVWRGTTAKGHNAEDVCRAIDWLIQVEIIHVHKKKREQGLSLARRALSAKVSYEKRSLVL